MSATPPAGRDRPPRAPLRAELWKTASLAAWGLWVFCVLILVAFAAAFGAAVFGLFS